MSVTIKQATWGDETQATDITESIQKQMKNGSINLVANSSLIPAVTLFNTVANLSDDDKADIKTQAIANCQGNANDVNCIAAQTANLEASTLQTKIARQNSPANIIEGRRLTVNIIDEKGNEKTVMVPEGQTLTAGKSPATTPTSSVSSSVSSTTISFLTKGGGIIVTIILAVLWVFSIAATYRALVMKNHIMVAYVLTALAIFIPYSGLITTPVALAIFSYLEKQPKSV
jgi:hypothetical protein